MKKTFTLFSVSALFLMLLFPVSLKAETIISFAIPNSGWTWGNQTDDCAGNFNDQNVVNQGAFVWSGGHDAAVKRIDDTWTGVSSGSKCCTRNLVPFTASTYTITLVTKRLSDNVTMTLPTITIQQGTPSTHYAATASWDNGSEQQEETISNHEFRYTEENGKNSRDREVTLTYNNVVINSAGSYKISIEFPNGDKDKYQMKTLTITPNCTQHTVTVAADDNNKGTVAGGGSYCENSEVTVTASPNENYSFTGWSSSDITIADAGANPLVFTMPGNAVSVTANFAACTKHTVTLAANNGSYGSVSGGGEQCDGSVTVTATPNSGYRFVNWTQGGSQVSTNAEYTFTLSADISLTANFEEDPCTNTKTIQCEDETIYRINSSLLTNGTPTPTYEKSHSYYSGADGDYVDFKGTAGEHYYMVHLPAATYSFTVYKAHAGNSWLNIWVADLGSALTYNGVNYGKHHGDGYDIRGDDDGYQDKPIHNSTVSNITLTEGDYIIGLYGNEYAAFDKIVIVADDEVFCEPVCTKHTVTLADDGHGSASGGGLQCDGSVTVTATPDDGYRFVNWTQGGSQVSTDAVYTFTLSEDISLTANFAVEICSNNLTIQCEDETIYRINSSLLTNGTPTPTYEKSHSYYSGADGDYVDFKGTAGEHYYMVHLPAATYSFTVYKAHAGNSWLNIWVADLGSALTYNGVNYGKHHGDGYDIRGDDDGYQDKPIHNSTVSNITLTEGDYIIGLYGNEYAAFDKIVITANSNVFCPTYDITMVNNMGGAVPTADKVKAEENASVSISAAATIGEFSFTGWTASPEVTFANASAANTTFTMPDEAVTITANYNTYSRTGAPIAAGNYGTICLPLNGTVTGATLYSVAGKEIGEKTYIVLEDKGTSLEAGKPYIFQLSADELSVALSGIYTDVQDGNGLVGTYETINPLTPYEEPGTLNYFLYANAFKKAGTDVTVGAYRAYLNLDAVGAVTPAPSARRIRMVIEETNSATGLEDLINDQLPVTSKVLIDGQLFIIREGKRYTLTGARVQ